MNIIDLQLDSYQSSTVQTWPLRKIGYYKAIFERNTEEVLFVLYRKPYKRHTKHM